MTLLLGNDVSTFSSRVPRVAGFTTASNGDRLKGNLLRNLSSLSISFLVETLFLSSTKVFFSRDIFCPVVKPSSDALSKERLFTKEVSCTDGNSFNFAVVFKKEPVLAVEFSTSGEKVESPGIIFFMDLCTLHPFFTQLLFSWFSSCTKVVILLTLFGRDVFFMSHWGWFLVLVMSW